MYDEFMTIKQKDKFANRKNPYFGGGGIHTSTIHSVLICFLKEGCNSKIWVAPQPDAILFKNSFVYIYLKKIFKVRDIDFF